MFGYADHFTEKIMSWLSRLWHPLNAPTEAKSSHSAPVRSPLQGIPTVKFDPSTVNQRVKVNLLRNIELLADLEKKHVKQVYEIALRSLLAGRDLHMLATALREIAGLPQKRAADVARSLHNKATMQITRERQAALGITHAKWMYPNAPCMVDPRHPTEAGIGQDAAHKAADGKIYDLSKGLLVDGKWTWPGVEDGCKCSSRPILPGSTR